MKQIIILYQVWALTEEQLIESSIIYYDIAHKEGRTDNVKEILKRNSRREYIENEMENTKSRYRWAD